jgi:hypothetical protein
MSTELESAGRSASRDELMGAMNVAWREIFAAAVMFHAAVAAKQGLTATEEKALDLLDRHGPLTAGGLGERAGLAPASVTGLLAGFMREAAGRQREATALLTAD